MSETRGGTLARVLDGWPDVVDDIDRLTCALGAISAGRACDRDAEALLRAVRIRIDRLAAHALRYEPDPEDALNGCHPNPERPHLTRIMRHIHGLVSAFDRVEAAALEFRDHKGEVAGRRLRVLAVELKDAGHDLDGLLA